MAFKQNIDRLCKDLELDGLPEQDNGIYLLPIGEGASIRMRSLGSGAYFDAALGRCPTSRRRGELFSEMMAANLFGGGTSHAVLGLDARGEGCTLSFALEDASEYRQFYDCLEEFLNQVDFWTKEIRGFQEG